MAAVLDSTVDRSFDTASILVNQLAEIWEAVVALIPNLLIGLFVILITWIIARYATKIANILTKSREVQPSLHALIDTLTRIGIWIMGILIALTVLLPGLTPTSLITGLGIGTVAIGFAFQDIFENFLAGIFIMARRKMRIGDYIISEGVEGIVEEIKLRETHIRRLSRELSIVPNGKLFKNTIEIVTDEGARRHEITVGVAYDTDLEMAREAILAAVKRSSGVSSHPAPDVLANEFNSSSIDFVVRWWSGSGIPDMLESRDSVVRNIKIAFDDAGIEIPFPQVTMSFKDGRPNFVER